MIHNLAEILKAFVTEESLKLQAYELEHAPTIGAMYEGLTSSLVQKSIPPELDLRVVSGFVTDFEGNLSGQMDCMLVRGEGEAIPHTIDYKWPVWDVLAVFEVKKNLYGAQLRDSFKHLREVSHSFSRWLHSGLREDRSLEISSALRAFSKITGIVAPKFADYESLPQDLQLIYYTLVLEQLAPTRIVLGYGGYHTQNSLRSGLCDFLESEGAGYGLGVSSFPHLITCNGNSLMKINGQPYLYPMQDEYWYFYVSSATNPIWLMLELLWAKIENACSVCMPWGDGLQEEIIHPFLAAKRVSDGEKTGWYYRYDGQIAKDKEHSRDIVDWRPTEVSETQFVIFGRLCSNGPIDVNETAFREYVEGNGFAVSDFVRSLQRTGYVAIDGTSIQLTTEKMQCAILPTGKFIVGENNTGRLSRYITALLKDEGVRE